MENQATLVFAGGGTGGHLFPGIAVAEAVRARLPRANCIFVGSGRALEKDVVERHGFVQHALPVEPSTDLFRKTVRFAWRFWKSWRASQRLLRDERPRCVVGLGGFASAPVVLAARGQKIPIVLLEQNIVPGRATRLLARWASEVCLSFTETARHLPPASKCTVTGNPLRAEVAALFHETIPDPAQGKPVLLILGGSQGARAVNDAWLDAAAALGTQLSDWRIIHQTGAHDVDAVRARYTALKLVATVEPFFSDMAALYRRTGLIVSRAGATTLAELACAGCPAILVPYPDAIADHQLQNARKFAHAGGAAIVEQVVEPRETAEVLAAAVAPLLSDDARLQVMRAAMRQLARPDAAAAVADCILRHSGLSAI